jgi:NADH-quinone oxidoreductase subunit N
MTLDTVLALLPQLILAVGATLVLIIGAWINDRRLWLTVGIGLTLVAAFCAGVLEPAVVEIEGMYATSPYARFCAVLWLLTIAALLLLSPRYMRIHAFGAGEYVSLLLFAGAGMTLLSASTSLVGLFVSLEAFTLALYILIAFKRGDDDSAEAGLKYLVLGSVATGFMAFAIGLIYAATGSFHFSEAMAALQLDDGLRPLGLAAWALFLVAVGFKISLVPFHFWTPDVYQGAPAPVGGLLATAAKGAVLAALLPLLGALGEGAGEVKQILWLLAVITMLVGTLAALPQTNLKRMLAYSSVVHMGYLVIALLIGGNPGGRALLFYLVIYSLATLGAFGVVASFTGEVKDTQEYADLQGIGWLHPGRSLVLAACLLSLAGIPPLAGFFAKFGLFRAALAHGYAELAVIGVLASLVSVYYYLRPLMAIFMRDDTTAQVVEQGAVSENLVLVVCLVALLFLGVFPGPLLNLVALVLP